MNKEYLNWDEYFMAVALLSARRSKDPSTRVGACIVSPDNRIIGVGYNGLPRKFDDSKFSWDNREKGDIYNKYNFVVHAELNAILNSTKELHDGRIYVSLFPCNECAKAIIQSGITEVIYLDDKYASTNEVIASKKMFSISQIKTRLMKSDRLLDIFR